MANAKKMTIEETIRTKKALMDVLEDVLEDINYREKSLLRDYVADGEEQRTDSEGHPLYLDEYGERTTEVTEQPVMKTIYKDIQRKPEDLEDRDKAKYEAIQIIKEKILELV